MASIEQTDKERALLKAVFDCCSIKDIAIAAHRMEGRLSITAQQAWDAEVSVKHPNQSIPASRFFELQKKLDGPQTNHLYLVPSRKLLETEWLKVKPVLQSMFNAPNTRLPFESGIKVMTEDNVLHLVRKPSGP